MELLEGWWRPLAERRVTEKRRQRAGRNDAAQASRHDTTTLRRPPPRDTPAARGLAQHAPHAVLLLVVAIVPEA